MAGDQPKLSIDNSNGVSTTQEAEEAKATQKSEDKPVNSTKRTSKPGPAVKPTSERLAESVHLVTQLAGVGVGSTHPHMVAFRAILNRWIREEDFAYNDHVDFIAYGRRGDLVLPRVKGHVASLRLRSI